MAEQDAIEKSRAHCAAEGKQFIQQHTETHDGLVVAVATVTGICVGPGDPGYQASQPSTAPKP